VGSPLTEPTESVELPPIASTVPELIANEVKTWAAFFKMVRIDALTATEAQKKKNTHTRTEQINKGLIAAKEQGLGEWSVGVAGRSFVRVGD
jgi:hypothetical protein